MSPGRSTALAVSAALAVSEWNLIPGDHQTISKSSPNPPVAMLSLQAGSLDSWYTMPSEIASCVRLLHPTMLIPSIASSLPLPSMRRLAELGSGQNGHLLL